MPATTINTAAASSVARLSEQAMNSGDADVEKPFDPVAHHCRRERRFFGNRDIRSAGGNHQNVPFPVIRIGLAAQVAGWALRMTVSSPRR